MVKKDYVKELEAMMLTEAEFRAEVVAQMKWEKFIKQQGTDDGAQATVRLPARTSSTARWSAPGTS